MTEPRISREKALAILTACGQAEDYDPLDDYYLHSDDGAESLWVWGQDEPLAVNRSGLSWASPGHPPYVPEAQP